MHNSNNQPTEFTSETQHTSLGSNTPYVSRLTFHPLAISDPAGCPLVLARLCSCG